MKAERVKKMKIFQAHAAEDINQEVEEEANKYEESREEYVLTLFPDRISLTRK